MKLLLVHIQIFRLQKVLDFPDLLKLFPLPISEPEMQIISPQGNRPTKKGFVNVSLSIQVAGLQNAYREIGVFGMLPEARTVRID